MDEPIATTDLCDDHPGEVRVAAPVLRDFGGAEAFSGPIATVRVFEDNVLVRQALEEPGEGRVLVVDGGGSLACALLGDRLAALALANGWAGVLVHGCVRDAARLRELSIGVKALGAHPRRSGKVGEGERDVSVTFAGVTFAPGWFVTSDADGVVVTERPPRTVPTD
ncbi:MAG: ribonuclease E activity regulator RraA [Planctomycetaceae bacterium]